MNISLEHPWALAILALAIPFWWMAWRSVPVLGRWKCWGGLALRVVVLLLLTFAVARPSIVRETDAMSVLVVADASWRRDSSGLARALGLGASAAVSTTITSTPAVRAIASASKACAPQSTVPISDAPPWAMLTNAAPEGPYPSIRRSGI